MDLVKVISDKEEEIFLNIKKINSIKRDSDETVIKLENGEVVRILEDTNSLVKRLTSGISDNLLWFFGAAFSSFFFYPDFY